VVPYNLAKEISAVAENIKFTLEMHRKAPDFFLLLADIITIRNKNAVGVTQYSSQWATCWTIHL
jgi:hypothetical protein